MSGDDITIAVAVLAGVISFLSPCVLPIVPAYLGQLTAIAVIASADGRQPSRWLALRHSAAFVLGFGSVFTILGVTATFAAGPLFDYLPWLRTIGGVVLIVLGLSLAGILRVPVLERTWRPLDAGAQARSRRRRDRGTRGRGRRHGRGRPDGRPAGRTADGPARLVRARRDLRGRAGRHASGSSSAASSASPRARRRCSRAPSCWSPTRSGSASRSCSSGALRPRPGTHPPADPSWPGGVARRRPARRRDRRRDAVRLARLLPRWFQFGGVSGAERPGAAEPAPRRDRASGVPPRASEARPRRALQRPPDRRVRLGRRRRGRADRRDDAARPDRRSRPGRSQADGVRAAVAAARGLRPGDVAPELGFTREDGSAFQLHRSRRGAGPARHLARTRRMGQLLGELVPALPGGDDRCCARWPRGTRIAASRCSASASRRRAPTTSAPTPSVTSWATR